MRDVKKNLVKNFSSEYTSILMRVMTTSAGVVRRFWIHLIRGFDAPTKFVAKFLNIDSQLYGYRNVVHSRFRFLS